MKPIRSVVCIIAVCTAVVLGTYNASAQSRVQTEEYAVYSALVERMNRSEQIKLVVIKEETVSRTLDAGFLTKNEKLSERLAPLVQQTLEDYIDKNREVHKLSIDLDIELPYKLLTKAEEIEIFKIRDKEHDGWKIFSEKYPGAFGYTAFSAVGFNSAMDQALVFVSHYCGWLCGSGSLVVLVKHEGIWESRGWLMLWVS